MPPSLAICLDLEDRSVGEIEDLARRSKGLISFLPRRCYENYLLDPEMICKVLNQHLEKTPPALTEDIRDWIQKSSGSREYYSNQAWVKKTVDNWIELIDAPKILRDLFNKFSNSTVSFVKTVHSVELTKRILENNPEGLADLLKYVSNLVVH